MRSRIVLLAVAVCCVAPRVGAEDVGNLLLRFFSPSNPVILRENPEPFNHAAHFISQENAQAILRELNTGIATQVSTFPLGSSSPGFTYTFDPSVGVFSRSAESFGPVFGERPLTAGRKKFSFGISHLDAKYDQFEGQDLESGDIKLYLRHKDTNADVSPLNPWFEGDIIRADLFLELESQTTVLFANYGLTQKLDVGLALPLQKVSLNARIHTTIEHLATEPDPFVVHAFSNGTDDNDFTESGSKSGIGDIVLRGKYNFYQKPSLGMAAGLDLRLPTGDDKNLLGTGGTQAKLYLIAGGAPKRFSPRASLGYTISSGGSDFTGDLPNELNYTAGFDAALHPRVTLTADVLGRTLFSTRRLNTVTETFTHTLRTDPTVITETRQALAAESGDLTLLLGAANLKINLAGRLLLNGGVLVALGDSGLSDKLTPTVGLAMTGEA
jgi:hypothetical protein